MQNTIGQFFGYYPVTQPTPPPLPVYDPNEEAPKWSYNRLRFIPPVEKSVPWPKVGDQPEDDSKPDWRGVIKNNINPLPLPEEYKFGDPQDARYFWFDTPDYADPFQKLWYSFKFFGRIAGVCHCIRGAFVDKVPFTLAENMRIFRLVSGPVLAAGLAGSTAVMVTANLRGRKDDMWNYAVGGFVAGSIIGRRIHTNWFWSVCFFTPLAIFFKYNAETNGYIYPTFNWRRANFSLSGNSTEDGLKTGDLRIIKADYGDPGRSVRKLY